MPFINSPQVAMVCDDTVLHKKNPSYNSNYLQPDLNAIHAQRKDKASSSPTTNTATPPTSPPVLPPRNQASVVEATQSPTEGPTTEKEKEKESINLIKRITQNLKRSKSPPSTPTNVESNGGGPSTTSTPRSGQAVMQPRHLQAAHGRSGSCPSQLLDLSALKVNLPPRTSKLGDTQNALVFGSQRVRGQKDRPALHSLHRPLGRDDLTSLGAQPSLHKKSHSMDAGTIISTSNSSDQNGNPLRNATTRSGSSSGVVLKER